MDSPNIVLAMGTYTDTTLEREYVNGRATIRLEDIATPELVRSATKEADGIAVTTNPLTRDHFEAFGAGVRVIGRAGIGLDSIDLEAARNRGVAVIHLPDYATTEVATHAAALILALHRHLREADEIARERWQEWRSMGEIVPIGEQTLGIVGFGRIGRAVAERMRPFVPSILAYDPLVTSPSDTVEMVPSLDTLLARSDIVTLHLPLTTATRGLLGTRELKTMRPGALLINVSRGALIDEDSLATALEESTLGGAALDVLASEPPTPGAPILRAPRTLLTPHVAWYSSSAERRSRTQVVESMLAHLHGEPLPFGRYAVGPGDIT